MAAASAVGLLGLAMVAGVAVAVVWRIRWLGGTLRTRAEVLGVSSHEEEGGGQYNFMETVFVSRLQFATPDGGLVHFQQRHGTSRPRFGVGDQVTIRYHRDQPSETAEVPFLWNELMVWFGIVVTGAMGSAFLFAGVQMMR
jgi:Protein of unknown function (DUF3592)